MTDIGNTLRSTSDALMRDLERLNELETKKRSIEPGDPELVELATHIEQIARRLLSSTVTQRELTERIEDLVAEGHPAAPEAPIEETPREIHVILAEWRDLERSAADLGPGSPEAIAAAARSNRLRDEYRRAHDAAQRRDASRGRG
jgi:Rad3-related DNA helicase